MSVYFYLRLPEGDDFAENELSYLLDNDVELRREDGAIAFYPDPFYAELDEDEEGVAEAIFEVTGDGLGVRNPPPAAIGKLAHLAKRVGGIVWCDTSDEPEENLAECMALYPPGLVIPDELPAPPPSETVPYSARATFVEGQRVEHATFGLGTVKTAAGKQVTITFENGETRKLAQGIG